MLELSETRGVFGYSLWSHPVGRVLKFEIFSEIVMKASPSGSVLDYGCGDRPYEDFLLRYFERYVAVDYRPSNAIHGRRPDLYLDDGKVALADGTFDWVVLTEVLEHIYEPVPTLREIYRLLAPGGVLVGSVPFAIGEHEAPYDFHRYTSFCLQRMFEDAGFEVMGLKRVGDLMTVLMADYQKVVGVIAAGITKAGFGWVSRVLRLVGAIPVWLGYHLQNSRLYPKGIGRLEAYPLGFVFQVRKPPASE